MAIVFHLTMWMGIILLVVFLVLSTYRILTGRALLPFATVERERARAPLFVLIITGLLAVSYLGQSYLQGSLL